MKKRLFLLMLALSLALSGCVYRATTSGPRVDIYRLNADPGSGGTMLLPETVSYSEEDKVLDVIRAGLNAEPGKTLLLRAFPEGVNMVSCRVEKGTATVEMSESYGLLEGTEKLLADYAITMTLSSLDAVNRVDIVCEGRTMAQGLSPEDVQLGDDGFETYTRLFKLYLPDVVAGGLRPQSATVLQEGKEETETLVCRALMEELDFLPGDTELLYAVEQRGCCFVNLSPEFLDYVPANREEARLILYAFVNTLGSLTEVDSVLIQVEGMPLTEYAGYSAAWPLTPDESLMLY